MEPRNAANGKVDGLTFPEDNMTPAEKKKKGRGWKSFPGVEEPGMYTHGYSATRETLTLFCERSTI